MYIYFDRNGTIKEVINDESIRKGSSDYNKIYCYLEGNPDIDDIWYLQKNPDGTLTNEVSFVDNIVTKAIPYDAKRDMKYFQDFEEYQFYVFTLSSSYLSQNGLVVATIRVAENNTLWALGELTFNVQANIVNSNNDITQSQYDYLLLTISSYYSKTEIDNKLSLKADKSDTYTKTQVDNKLDLKADKTDTYTKTQVDNKLDLKADLNNSNQNITAKVYNSIGGYFYIVGSNTTTQYYSDRIYNSTNNLTWLFPSTGGTFALTSQISSLQNQVTANANEISTLKSVQNVVDTVATYSALTSLATTHLDANDKVQVIADETHGGATTIYNWNGSSWVYVGAYGGNSYTKAQVDSLLDKKASKNGSASEDFTTNNLTVSGTASITGNTTIGGTASVTGNVSITGNLELTGNETLAGDLVYNGSTSLTSKMATKADLSNNNQTITAHAFNSINGYFYITGPNETRQYYSDRIYNSTNNTTLLFPSRGGTFARTSDIASAKSELQTQITANADKIDNAINNLRWELGSHTLDVESDTTTAYTKTVPSGAIGCQINKIGGMSYKYNQLVQNGNFESTDKWGAYGGTISVSNNVATFTMTTDYTGGGNNYMNQFATSTVAGHTYLSYCEVYIPSSNARLTAVTAGCRGAFITPSSQPTDKWFAISGVVTISTANNIFLIAPNTATSVDDYIMARNCMCIDLTAMYGSGNEPTDVATATTELLKRGIDINEYQAYDSGSIRDSAVTDVKSYKTNLYQPTATSTTSNGITYTISSDGTITMNGTSTATVVITTSTNLPAGTYTWYLFNKTTCYNSSLSDLADNLRMDLRASGAPFTSSLVYFDSTNKTKSFTIPSSADIIYIRIGSGVTIKSLVFKPLLILTNGSSGIKETLTIPTAIQNLTGYGWGVNDTCYNYIDYANKKFVQKVIKFTLESTSFTYYGNENVTVSARLSQELYYLIGQQTFSANNNANSMSSEYPLKNYGQDGGYYFASDNFLRIKDTSITSLQDFVTKYPNGITFLFELATPIETDISEYLDDNSIEVEPNGTLTFNNTYEQTVPSDIDYLIEEVKA